MRKGLAAIAITAFLCSVAPARADALVYAGAVADNTYLCVGVFDDDGIVNPRSSACGENVDATRSLDAPAKLQLASDSGAGKEPPAIVAGPDGIPRLVVGVSDGNGNQIVCEEVGPEYIGECTGRMCDFTGVDFCGWTRTL